MATVRKLKADLLYVSPSSEQIKELWVVYGSYCRTGVLRYWWEHGNSSFQFPYGVQFNLSTQLINPDYSV